MSYGYKENQSRYCYEGTNVLINKFDIRDSEKLKKLEADITQHNLMRLEKNPVMGNFDLKHIQKIHFEIFKDLYDFAGKIREERIYKGNTEFCLPQYINTYSQDIFKDLKKENYLKDLNKSAFAEKAAHYMAEINILHPFREGNGRTQREFVRSLALNAGYKLDWSMVNKDTLLDASIKSVIEPLDLAEILEECIENAVPDREYSKTFDQNKDYDR